MAGEAYKLAEPERALDCQLLMKSLQFSTPKQSGVGAVNGAEAAPDPVRQSVLADSVEVENLGDRVYQVPFGPNGTIRPTHHPIPDQEFDPVGPRVILSGKRASNWRSSESAQRVVPGEICFGSGKLGFDLHQRQIVGRDTP